MARQGLVPAIGGNVATFKFTLKGKTPLLMHPDDVMFSDAIKAWQGTEAGRASPNGDDRWPAWRWHGHLYKGPEKVCMPTKNIMAAIRGGAFKVTLKGKTTFGRESQSGLSIFEEFCDFEAAKGEVSLLSLAEIRELPFAEQAQRVEALGFALDVQRATIGTSKHVRVRPRFAKWTVRGRIEVTSKIITRDILAEIFDKAGNEVGLGDWRPSAKKPGPYGRFDSELSKGA
jgi:hypothetical protein